MIPCGLRASLLAFLCIAAISCKRDNDINCPAGYVQVGDDCEQEQELITTLTVYFTLDSTEIAFYFRDPDGPGGNDPSIDTIRLTADTVYSARLELLDESKNPAVNITSEINSESNDHQFFYSVSAGLNLSVAYRDTDGNGLPVGILTNCTTGAAGSGSLSILLKHQPGIKDGNAATGTTDVDATFPVALY